MRRCIRLLAVVVCLLFAVQSFAETFLQPRRIATSGTPYIIFTGDLNGDGRNDILYRQLSGPLQTFLSSGNGYVPGPDTILPSNTAYSCLAADLDRDGKVDVACTGAYQFTEWLVFLHGNGDGTFAAPIRSNLPDTTSTGVYAGPLVEASGDLNRDGIPDLVLMQAPVGTVLGDGAGGFRPAPGTGPGTAMPVALADINGDGKTDVLFQDMSVALGNGDGTATGKSWGAFNGLCTYADMDRDGHLDAVCGAIEVTGSTFGGGDINGATHLLVYPGYTDGSFSKTPIVNITYGDHTSGYDGYGSLTGVYAVADVNGDGFPDVLGSSEDGYTIILGRAGLKFDAPRHFAGRPLLNKDIYWNHAFADMDGDGIPDVINPGPLGIYITYTAHDGTAKSSEAFTTNGVTNASVVADFDGDGKADVISAGDHHLTLSRGRGDGTFQPFQAVTPRASLPTNDYGGLDFFGITAYPVFAADVDGDGKKDVLTFGTTYSGFGGNGYLQKNLGNGNFGTPVLVPGLNPFNLLTRVADVNGDGREDLVDIFAVTTNHAINSLMPGANGNFTVMSSPVPTDSLLNFKVGDVTGDGRPDVVTAGQNGVYVMQGDGTGRFALSNTLRFPTNTGISYRTPANSAIGDFNGDGKMDIAVLMQTNESLAYGNGPPAALIVYLGDGHGGFASGINGGATSLPYSAIETVDLDNDGKDDLVLYSTGQSYTPDVAGTLHGTANGTFGPLTILMADGGTLVQPVDLNGDGFKDLVFSFGIHSDGVLAMMNLGNTDAITGTINASPEPAQKGSAFDLLAALSSPNNNTLSGSIQFFVDGNAVGTAPLSGSSARITVPGNYAIGTHTLAAIWSGDADHTPITLTGTHVVRGYPLVWQQWSATPNVAVYGTTVQLSGTLTGSGPTVTGTVDLRDGTTLLSTVTLNGTAATYSMQLPVPNLTVGLHAITATYNGDTNYGTVTATLGVTIQGLPSTVTVVAVPMSGPAGYPFTFTAHVANASTTGLAAPTPTGTVSFSDAGTALGSAVLNVAGTAPVTASFLAPGQHIITVVYPGDASHVSGTASTSIQVNPVVTALTLTSRTNPSLALTSPVVDIKLLIPLGSTLSLAQPVSIRDGVTTLGTVTLSASGTGTFNLPTTLKVGSHVLSAVFNGSESLVASTSSPVVQVVNRQPITITLGAAPASMYQGQSTTLTTTLRYNVAAPTGYVTYFEGATQLGQIAVPATTALSVAVPLTLNNLSVGTHTITATYGGDASFSFAIAPQIQITILPSDFTLSSTTTSITMQTQHHLVFPMTAQSIGNFADTLQFSATLLPDHARVFYTPTTAALSAGGTATTSAWLETSDVISYESKNSIPDAWKLTLAGLALPFLGLFRRRTLIRNACLATLLIVLCISTNGCGSKLPGSVAPGSYTLHLTATGKTTGRTHTLDIPWTVTP